VAVVEQELLARMGQAHKLVEMAVLVWLQLCLALGLITQAAVVDTEEVVEEQVV
jgi:hypothetical protein